MNYDEMVKCAYEDIVDSFEKEAADWDIDAKTAKEIQGLREWRRNLLAKQQQEYQAQEDKMRRLAQRAALGAGTVGLGLAGLGTYGVIKARQMYRDKKKREEQRDKNQSEIKEALKSYLANKS